MPPELIGPYVLVEEIPRKQGNMSVVRRAMDTRDGTFVAIKILKPTTDDFDKVFFEREAASLAGISHPGIVRYRSHGVHEGSFYIVLDWLEETLEDLLTERPWQTWDEFCGRVGLPITDALAHLHLRNVEHRDIKPANILISPNGRPVLADFGLAKLTPTPLGNETIKEWGTPLYMPPDSGAIRYVRDVYALGILFVQCMSDTALHDYASVERGLGEINVPPDIRGLLKRCIAVQPSERPTDASNLLAELVRLQQGRVHGLAKRRHPIQLGLTRKALAVLTGTDDGDRKIAGAAVVGDLSDEVYARFITDADGQITAEAMYLYGNSYRFTVRKSEDDATVRITNAQERDLRTLESDRRRAMQVPGFYQWTTARVLNQDDAAQAVETLWDSVNAFHDQQGAHDLENAESKDLFATWGRVLDARERLAQGERSPLAYTSVREIRGGETEFVLEGPLEADVVGTEWVIVDRRSERRAGRGEVVEQQADRLVLLGPQGDRLPSQGFLNPDLGPSGVALRRQRDALASVRDGKSVRRNLRDLLTQPESNGEPECYPVNHWGAGDLDANKRDAIEKALGAPDVFLVQGPPGTGKTRFITELVDQFLKIKPHGRVLIASQTNAAVDNALERLEGSGRTNMVRLASSDPKRVDPSVQHLLLDPQKRRWTEAIRTAAHSHLAAEADAVGVEIDHLRAALALQQFASSMRQIDWLGQSLARDQELDAPSELDTALVEPTSGPRIRQRIEVLKEECAELLGKARNFLDGALPLGDVVTGVEATTAVAAILGDAQDGERLLALVELQSEWLQAIVDDETLTATFLDQTSVIAGTCLGFLRNKGVQSLQIDMCIVDEASRATLTEALVPVSRAGRWVIVGDTNQLPPSDEELLRNKALMDQNSLDPEDVEETLFDRWSRRLPEHSRTMLDQQYRMIRPIGDMISTVFYEGRLKSPNETGLAGYEAAFGKPVLWVDTTSLGDARRETARSEHSTSIANRGEARQVMKQLERLHSAIQSAKILPPAGREALEVLLIAPYAAQVKELDHAIAPLRSRLPELRLSVASVDAAQGRETDIAVFSMTRSNGRAELGFLGASYWRRINVALSRARYGLVIVGDTSFVNQTTGALANVLKHIETHTDDCEIRAAMQ